MDRNATIGDSEIPFYHWKDRKGNGKEYQRDKEENRAKTEEGVKKQ